MSDRVTIDGMTDAIMGELEKYRDMAAEDLKEAVKETGNDVKKDISANAPVRTGKYKKSWAVKKTAETAESIELVVHSKNRYQIAHLLENGHAKRGGGRVSAIPHIKPAEQRGETELVEKIKRKLEGGG